MGENVANVFISKVQAMVGRHSISLASQFTLALAVLGTGLDTSIGLNFLILFIIISTLNIVFNKTVRDTNTTTSDIALPAIMFFLVYCIFIISEIITTGQVGSGLRVVVNFLPVGFLLPIVILAQKNGVSFRSLHKSIVGVAVLYAIFAAYEVWVLGNTRAGFGYNPIPLGMIAVQFLFWTCVSSQNDQISKFECAIGIVAAFWVIFLTGSRMPILVAVLIILPWLFLPGFNLRFKFITLVGIALIIPLQRFLNHEAYSIFINRIESLLWWFDYSAAADTAGSSSGISRMEIWRVAWELIKEKPLFGWGSRQTLDHTIQTTYGSPDFIQTYPHFHNEILDISVRFGLLGSISVILAYCSILWIAKKTKQFFVLALFLMQLFMLSLTDIIFVHSMTLSMFVFSILVASLWILAEKEKLGP